MKVLYRFKHGLGDCCQFQIFIRHLKKHHPNLFVGVETNFGKHTLFRGVADAYHPIVSPYYWRADYNQIVEVSLFDIPNIGIPKAPCTKATKIIYNHFWDPEEELYYYECHPDEDTINRVQKWIPGKYGLLHAFGHSGKNKKDLTLEEAWIILDWFKEHDLIPIILDFKSEAKWDENVIKIDSDNELFQWHRQKIKTGKNPSPELLHEKAIGETKGLGDGATIYELIRHADCFVGVDSGPAHIAAATKTPTMVIWTENHPFECFDLADNVVHLIPDGIHEPDYFKEKYLCLRYKDDLADWLCKNLAVR